MHEVLVNRLGGLNLPRKSVVRLTDRPDMTLDVYRGRKTTIQQQGFQAFILKLCTAVKSILKMCMCFCKIAAVFTLTFQTLVSSID